MNKFENQFNLNNPEEENDPQKLADSIDGYLLKLGREEEVGYKEVRNIGNKLEKLKVIDKDSYDKIYPKYQKVVDRATAVRFADFDDPEQVKILKDQE